MSKMKTPIKIIYNSDPRFMIDNHQSEAIFLLDVDERSFTNVGDAIKFYSECTSPITQIEEVIPELNSMKKKFDWILPESHIRPKHMLLAEMENVFINQQANDWR